MKGNSNRLGALVIIGGISLTGCATIMHGTTQPVGISSQPTGATVSIDGQLYGNTPVIASLKRKNNHIVNIELKGYEPYATTLTRQTSGWVFGNIILGGLIGLAVDAISGGLYELTPEQISVALRKGGVAMAPREDTLYMNVVMKVDPKWKKVAQLKRQV